MQIVSSYTLEISLRSVFELELQCVMQAAARDYIREQCLQLDRQARSRQEALRKLHSQWQSILDFRQLVVRVEGHCGASHNYWQYPSYFLNFVKFIRSFPFGKSYIQKTCLHTITFVPYTNHSEAPNLQADDLPSCHYS